MGPIDLRGRSEHSLAPWRELCSRGTWGTCSLGRSHGTGSGSLRTGHVAHTVCRLQQTGALHEANHSGVRRSPRGFRYGDCRRFRRILRHQPVPARLRRGRRYGSRPVPLRRGDRGPADRPFEAGHKGTALGLTWIGGGDIVAVSELTLPNGRLYVLSRRSGTSGSHGMIGVDGAYRGLVAECDYGAQASDADEGWIEIHSRCRFNRPGP